MMPASPRFVSYARVSTEEQARPGCVSIEAQLEAANVMARSLGGEVIAVEHDVLSGLDGRRPGYQRVLALARAGDIDGVVVWRLDRFSRDHVEAFRAVEELSALGVQVHSATEPISEPFVRDLMLLLANRESRVTSQRVKMAMKARAAAGQWQGRPPTGYRIVHDNGVARLQPDEQAPLVLRLFELAAEGTASVRRLREEADRIGLRSGTGHLLSRAHIHKLMTNPAYVGDVVHGRYSNGRFEKHGPRPKEHWTVTPNAHDPIVPRALFDRVQELFAQHKQIQGDVRATPWLLTGILYCGLCGQRMYGRSGGRGNHSYACHRAMEYGRCTLTSTSGKALDAWVKDQISALRITPELRQRAMKIVSEDAAKHRDEYEEARHRLLRARERHDLNRMNLARQMLGQAGRLIAPDIYERLEREEVAAIRAIDYELSSLPAEPQPVHVDPLIAALSGIEWNGLDERGWREAVLLLVTRIEASGLGQYRLSWSPAADLLRRTLSTSHVG